MSDCNYCSVEKECHYPYKPCDCVHQRKFWSKERREEYDASENLKLNKAHVSGQLPFGNEMLPEDNPANKIHIGLKGNEYD